MRDHGLAVRCECERFHGGAREAQVQHAGFQTVGGVPQDDGGLPGAGGQAGAIRGEGHGPEGVRVGEELPDQRSGGRDIFLPPP